MTWEWMGGKACLLVAMAAQGWGFVSEMDKEDNWFKALCTIATSG